MARKKRTEQEKDNIVINILKITGVFVNVIGFYMLIMITAAAALGAVGVLTATTALKGPELLNSVAKNVYLITTVSMSVVLIYELLNYVLYLYKAKGILLMALVVEIITMIVLCVLLHLGTISIQSYALIIPILSGILNYFILVLQEDEKE